MKINRIDATEIVNVEHELLPAAKTAKKRPSGSAPVQDSPPPKTSFSVPAMRRSSGAKNAEPDGFDAWSFSRWETYEGCPLKAKFKFIDKLKEPDSPVMARGSAIHAHAQAYLERQASDLDASLSQFPVEFGQLRAKAPHCEEEWAFTREWKPTGWFAKGEDAAWCRVKMDAFTFDERSGVLGIVDFKTGKARASHDLQLELYGLAGFLRFPKATMVVAEDWYLDLGTAREKKFPAEQKSLLLSTWNDRVAPMFADRRFCANPTRACTWCHYRANNGGPCKW